MEKYDAVYIRPGVLWTEPLDDGDKRDRMGGRPEDHRQRRQPKGTAEDAATVIAASKGTRCHGRAEYKQCLPGNREHSCQRKNVGNVVSASAEGAGLLRKVKRKGVSCACLAACVGSTWAKNKKAGHMYLTGHIAR